VCVRESVCVCVRERERERERKRERERERERETKALIIHRVGGNHMPNVILAEEKIQFSSIHTLTYCQPNSALSYFFKYWDHNVALQIC